MNRETKTTVPPAGGPDSPERRRFLTGLCLGLSALASAVVSIPVLGFVLAPLLRKEERAWRRVGSVEAFKVGATVAVTFPNATSVTWDGSAGRTAAWLRRMKDQEFVAFAISCTHLGCPVQWKEDANLFMCPCHGGVYYSNGEVAGGPPPRPLPRYNVRVRDGQVEIETAPIPFV
ncbi:MAG: Rieske 2Fe-2S domain-containing protein [Verrucomicrobiota bacterium]